MALNCATSQDVLKTIKDKNVEMVDLRFTDLPGVWQHFSVPPSAIDVDALEEGIGFDGSSIRGFQEPGKRHVGRAGCHHSLSRSVQHSDYRGFDLQRQGPCHRPNLHPGRSLR